jgi:hypothetical protein
LYRCTGISPTGSTKSGTDLQPTASAIVAGTLTGRDPVDPVPDEDLQVVETERTML